MQKLVKCYYKKHAFHSADNWDESYPKKGFIDRKNHRLYDSDMKEIEYGVYLPIFELDGKRVDYEVFSKDDRIFEFDINSFREIDGVLNRFDGVCTIVSVNNELSEIVIKCEKGSCEIELRDGYDVDNCTLKEGDILYFQACKFVDIYSRSFDNLIKVYYRGNRVDICTKCGEYKE